MPGGIKYEKTRKEKREDRILSKMLSVLTFRPIISNKEDYKKYNYKKIK